MMNSICDQSSYCIHPIPESVLDSGWQSITNCKGITCFGEIHPKMFATY